MSVAAFLNNRKRRDIISVRRNLRCFGDGGFQSRVVRTFEIPLFQRHGDRSETFYDSGLEIEGVNLYPLTPSGLPSWLPSSCPHAATVNARKATILNPRSDARKPLPGRHNYVCSV